MRVNRSALLSACMIAFALGAILSGADENHWTSILAAAVLGAVVTATAGLLVAATVGISRSVAHDVDADEHLHIDEPLRDTRARLARATHVSAVGEFSASIAHEINQPLAAIVAHGHACHRWLAENPPNISRALLSVERIIRDAKGAADVIQRVRALHSHAPPNKDVLSVNALIEETSQLIEAEARSRSIILRAELAKSLPHICADRVQIQQVLSNLTRNAMEAMEPVANRARVLYLVSIEQEGRVVIQVQDTGIGVKDLRSAFEPFYTTKPNGMGMGLAICRSIVKAHNGRLWAMPATPHGSIFSVSLPAVEVPVKEHLQ